jgi:hypothetical protein
MVELEDIVNGLESTADWRREKAAQYPHDDRNEKAAEILGRLATEVRGMGDSPVFKELVRAGDELSDLSDECRKYDLCSLIDDLSAYDRNVGFHSWPSSGEEYLRGMLEIYRDHIGKAKDEAAEAIREERATERRIRRKAAQSGYMLRKSRRFAPPNNLGKYALINLEYNGIDLGWNYDATLDEIEAFLTPNVEAPSASHQEA